MNMEKNVSKAIIKKNAVKELNSILKSPFAVMNLINKNRDSENIKNLLELYNIEYLNGDELKVIQIGKNYFEYIPIKFSVSAFFASLESALKIAKEEERLRKQQERATAKKEKKAAESKAKKEEKRAIKVAAKAKELKEKFSDLPDSMIMQLAEEFFKAA